MQTPAYIVHAHEVPEQEGCYPPPFDGEKLSLGRDLGRAAGSVNLGLWRERLPPGRRTSFTHAHSHEEELIYVLAGECHVRLIDPGAAPREVPLRPGDTVSFPAGTRIAHCFFNRSDRECELLCFGERRPGLDRVWYPEDSAYDAHLRATQPARSWQP